MAGKEKLTLKKKIIRSSIVIAILVAVVVLAYFILVWTGAWEYINSVEKVRNLILSLGFWGRFAFVLLQFLQVTFIPLPSTVTTLAGVLVYGPLETALLSLAGVILGSVFAFFLGRVFGRRLVEFMVGKETCDKWVKFLTNAKYSFFIMMVLPVFPDDVLCIVAGLTNMSWTFFVVTNLIARPIGIFTTCYLGSGHLIPYHGWGLAVWAVIVVVVGVLLFLSFKYQSKIEDFLQNKFRSKKVPAGADNVESKTDLQTAEEPQIENKEENQSSEEIKNDSVQKKEIDNSGQEKEIGKKSRKSLKRKKTEK